MGWALCSLKNNANFYMDMTMWKWGDDERVFVGQKLADGEWDLRAPGYGIVGKVPEARMPLYHKPYLSAYGNGAIRCHGRWVEQLGPTLGYEPDMPEESWEIWRKENAQKPEDLDPRWPPPPRKVNLRKRV